MFPSFAKNITLYEVNLRQYTPGGSIREFIPHLPRLKSMGVGMLWIMPIHIVGSAHRKGELGSYYSVRDYFSIDPAYGSLNDFKLLVKLVHDQGMFIILDWVANHTAWDNPLTLSHPEYYLKDDKNNFTPPFPEWADVIKLDFNNPEVWDYMISAMQYWVEETGIDGYRCDMANLVPLEFWNSAIQTLRSNYKVFMLAEAEDKQLLDMGFDAIYNWNILHFFNSLIHDRNNAARLDKLIESDFLSFNASFNQMLFTSNHDENSWNGSAIERLGSALEATTVLTFTLAGLPLIYSGQESGNQQRLSFFDKDLIQWKEDKMFELYQKLAFLRQQNPAIFSNPYGGSFKRLPNSMNHQIFTFVREKGENKILVVVNLSWDKISFVISSYLAEGEYVDLMTSKKVHIVPNALWTLEAWKFYILVK